MRFRKRFYVFVTLLLLVPPVLTSLLLFSTIDARETQTVRRMLDSEVRQASGTIDTVFSKLQADFVYLGYRNELLYLKQWAATSDYREKKNFLKDLDPYGTLSDYYDEALLVNVDDDWLVDIKNKNISPITGTRYRDSVDRELSVFRNRASQNAVLFSFQTVQERSTYLVRKIDFPSVGRSLYLCVRISEAFFRKVVDDTFLRNHSFLAIFEDGGTLVSLRSKGVGLNEPRVAQWAKDDAMPTGRFLVSRFQSAATGWRYLYGTDRAELDDALIGELVRASALVTAVLALLGVAVFVFSRRIYTPIGQLFQLFRSESQEEEPEDLETLTHQASALIESNRRLRETLEANQILEKEQFLLAFFDDPTPPETVPVEAVKLALDIDRGPGTAYAVCFAQAGLQGVLADFLTASAAKDKDRFLAAYFELGRGVRAEVFHPGRQRVAFLLSLPAAAGVPVSRLFRCGSELASVLALSFSRVHAGWPEIKTAYKEAEIALDHRPLFRERTILMYEDVQEKKSNFDLLAQTVRKVIEEKYRDYSLSLDSISQELRYSTSHLSAVFRNAYGETIKDFITQVRLERACELLLRSDKTVSIIALEVGYLNLGSFVKIFKTYRGETPKSFQRRSAAATSPRPAPTPF